MASQSCPCSDRWGANLLPYKARSSAAGMQAARQLPLDEQDYSDDLGGSSGSTWALALDMGGSGRSGRHGAEMLGEKPEA